MLAKNKEMNKSTKVWGYLSAILSPVSLLFILVIGFLIVTYKPSKFSISELEDSIGLSLPRGYKVNINQMTHSFQDYSAEVELEFEENELQELIKEIENSPFYNLQYNFNRSNAEEWLKSDTTVYWKVRNHLEEEKMTGYWKKGDADTYNFYTPNFSDIPNSAFLFNEGFDIEATLNIKSKKLIYRYYKL
jgi:hypothetical protein